MNGGESVRSVGIVLLETLTGIGALYVGREFCIPIALALFLKALLRPLVRSLERLRVPTVVGDALVVLGLLGGLTAAGFALADPVRSWVSQVPASLETAAHKLEAARRSLEQRCCCSICCSPPGRSFCGNSSRSSPCSETNARRSR
jgi:predicted PurR-regulated permease PerM